MRLSGKLLAQHYVRLTQIIRMSDRFSHIHTHRETVIKPHTVCTTRQVGPFLTVNLVPVFCSHVMDLAKVKCGEQMKDSLGMSQMNE